MEISNPQLSAGYGSISCDEFEGALIFVYISNCKVFIQNEFLDVIQVIQFRCPVEAVALYGKRGIIAVSYGTSIDLYFPSTLLKTSQRLEWLYAITLNQHYTAKALAWNQEGLLLACGTWLNIWEAFKPDPLHDSAGMSWINTLREKMPVEIVKAEYSPDGLLMALMGENDKFLKIWYCLDEKGSKDWFGSHTRESHLEYLYHSCPVQSFSWRKSSSGVKEGNMLLTFAKDNVYRIFKETHSSRLTIITSVNVAPQTFLFWLHSAELSELYRQTKYYNDYTAVEKEAANEISSFFPKKGLDVRAKEKVLEFVKSDSDLLMQLNPNGSLQIWNICNFENKSMVNLVCLVKVEDAMPPTLIRNCHPHLSVHRRCSTMSLYDVVFKEMILISHQPETDDAALLTINPHQLFSTGKEVISELGTWKGGIPTSSIRTLFNDGECMIFEKNLVCELFKWQDTENCTFILRFSITQPILSCYKFENLIILCHNTFAEILTIKESIIISKLIIELEGVVRSAGIFAVKDGVHLVCASAVSQDLFIYFVDFQTQSCTMSSKTETSNNFLDFSGVVFNMTGHSVGFANSPQRSMLANYVKSNNQVHILTISDTNFIHENSIELSNYDIDSVCKITLSNDLIVLASFQEEAKLISTFRKEGNDNFMLMSQFTIDIFGEIRILKIQNIFGYKQILLMMTDSQIRIYVADHQAYSDWNCIHCIELEQWVRYLIETPNLDMYFAENNVLTIIIDGIILSKKLLLHLNGKPGYLADIIHKADAPVQDMSMENLKFWVESSQYTMVDSIIQNYLIEHKLCAASEHNILTDYINILSRVNISKSVSDVKKYENLFDDFDVKSDIPTESSKESAVNTILSLLGSDQTADSRISVADQTIKFLKAYSVVKSNSSFIDQFAVEYIVILNSVSQNDPFEQYCKLAVWGRLSDTQDKLLEILIQMNGGILTDDLFKRLGVAIWYKNPDNFRKHVENLAKWQYANAENRDPVKCTLLYLALKKKKVVQGLWKLATSNPERTKIVEFLEHDFTEERWKQAAAKNAYALLGKQRYEFAMSFFLLADQLQDAISICWKHLQDLQLIIMLCRIFEGENSPTLKKFMKETFKEEDHSTEWKFWSYLLRDIFVIAKPQDWSIFHLEIAEIASFKFGHEHLLLINLLEQQLKIEDKKFNNFRLRVAQEMVVDRMPFASMFILLDYPDLLSQIKWPVFFSLIHLNLNLRESSSNGSSERVIDYSEKLCSLLNIQKIYWDNFSWSIGANRVFPAVWINCLDKSKESHMECCFPSLLHQRVTLLQTIFLECNMENQKSLNDLFQLTTQFFDFLCSHSKDFEILGGTFSTVTSSVLYAILISYIIYVTALQSKADFDRLCMIFYHSDIFLEYLSVYDIKQSLILLREMTVGRLSMLQSEEIDIDYSENLSHDQVEKLNELHTALLKAATGTFLADKVIGKIHYYSHSLLQTESKMPAKIAENCIKNVVNFQKLFWEKLHSSKLTMYDVMKHHPENVAQKIMMHLINDTDLLQSYLKSSLNEPIRLSRLSIDTSENESIDVFTLSSDIIYQFVCNPNNLTNVAFITSKQVCEIDTIFKANDVCLKQDRIRRPGSKMKATSTQLFSQLPMNPELMQSKGSLISRMDLTSDEGGSVSSLSAMTSSFHVDDQPNVVYNSVCQHPSDLLVGHSNYSYYFTAGHDSPIALWQFGQPNPIQFYNDSTSERVANLVLDPVGSRIGLAEFNGNAKFWRIDSHADEPFLTIECHNRALYDMTYCNTSTLLATIGYSDNDQNVCLWDTLLPNQSNCVMKFEASDHESRKLIFNQANNLLITGTKNGELRFYDIRYARCLKYLHGFGTNHVTALEVFNDNLLITAGQEGVIKFWDVKTFEMVDSWSYFLEKVRYHKSDKQPMHSAPVLQLKCIDNFLYTCGGDGSLRRFKLRGGI